MRKIFKIKFEFTSRKRTRNDNGTVANLKDGNFTIDQIDDGSDFF